jgi:hypothetical protein
VSQVNFFEPFIDNTLTNLAGDNGGIGNFLAHVNMPFVDEDKKALKKWKRMKYIQKKFLKFILNT